jgi:hypothetical protein
MMKLINALCPPAHLYLIYIAVHTALSLAMGLYWCAGMHVVSGLVGVWLLDSFCRVDLGVISWVVIATPFVVTALAMSIAMGLQLDHTLTKYTVEKFSPLTADDKQNRDIYVTQLKGGEAPIPSTSY